MSGLNQSEPRCVPLNELGGESAGGKADGLTRLVRHGFDVPPGFVIVGASTGSLPAELSEHYEAIGQGKVAVRSSAVGEDSVDASFAGQYDTVLNVEGLSAVERAVEDCLRSAETARATAYRDQQAGQRNVTMNVVVQRMVDARAAGVVFTANPVTARRDQIVIDAVAGLGEALVSGQATPDHWIVTPDGRVVERELQGDKPVISDDELRAVLQGALEVARRERRPTDLEWAIDEGGQLHWLQARPITGLPADPNEFDSIPIDGHVYTWCNIGEMMPGAVAPLTHCVTGRMIDEGMDRFYRRIGAAVPETNDHRYVATFFGHLFLNLTNLSLLGAQVAGSTKKDMCLALCGRDVEELVEPPPDARWKRAANGARYARLLFRNKTHRKDMDALRQSLSFESKGTAEAMFSEIDDRFEAAPRAFEIHLLSSAASGALSPILLGILARGEEPTQEHHATVAAWLAGATGVESADIAAGAEHIVDELTQSPNAKSMFADVETPQALAWLRSDASGQAGRAFEEFLQRHGHRAVRELEVRQKGWADDPTPLCASLQSGLVARLAGQGARPRHAPTKPDVSGHPIIGRLLPLAHAAVRGREHTKSGLVYVINEFKRAYRRLGDKMAAQGLLADGDAVFFLRHQEIGRLVRGESSLAQVAVSRRPVIDYQMPLRFPEVFMGRPEPLTFENSAIEGGLVGKPVSRGKVTGRARVVLNLEQASEVQAGEIMIAPITDVGWTPYFSLIAGLATDVGSAVSHGAVVAREYGLPAVVNLHTATSSFNTGDLVTLDGDLGRLTLATDG